MFKSRKVLKVLQNVEDIILKTGLYEELPIDITNDVDVNTIIKLEYYAGSLRAYCPDCKQETPFRRDLLISRNLHTETPMPHYGAYKTFMELSQTLVISERRKYAFTNRSFTLEFYCTHNQTHRIYFTFAVKDDILQKIGQLPSIADSMEEEIKSYKKELEKDLGREKSQEFSKAIGLFSHGVGIGSFVYLRRIFESFIYQAKDKAVAKGDTTEEVFNQLRMVEKIELLKDYLPEIIVENKIIYGVVSKGIHELSEDECKKYFNTIKTGIELILDEKIAKRKAEEKKRLFTAELSKVYQEIQAK